MRILLSVLVVVLLLIAIFGLGAGVLVVAAAAKAERSEPLGLAIAVVYGSVPFAIGTVALGALAVVQAVEVSGREQLAATNRLAEITLNEAKLAEQHRGASKSR